MLPVSLAYMSTHSLTIHSLPRHSQDIEELPRKITYHFCNPENWDAISRIIDCLGVEGMSGDETDTPTEVYPKIVRQVEILWISPHISQLFQAVNSYEPALQEGNMCSRLGNAPLPHHYEPCMKNTLSRPIPNLPCNWYSDTWFRGLFAGQRVALLVLADGELPTLVSATLCSPAQN